MTRPGPEAVFEALDCTWPSLALTACGPFRLRNGDGGGKRVSAATTDRAAAPDDIAQANRAMRALGQTPLYMIRDGNDALDELLDAESYATIDPTVLYLAPAQDLARTYPITTIIPAWPPLAIQSEIWAEGGIDASRIRVMERAVDPKVSLLGRIDDTPSATAFVAAHNDIAMLHALEVRPGNRCHGMGEILVRSAAHWAVEHGTRWLALAVTRANGAANALYAKLGMTPLAGYHYRQASEAAP